MLTRPRVVLFYPRYEGAPLGAPLCLLALAASLRNGGYEPVLVDAAIEPSYLQVVADHMETAVCLGISVLTGPMIGGAIEVATEVKRRFPKKTIIFGGWHPTLVPDETLRESYVDIVVRGQGEITLLEVVEALTTGSSLKNVAGISWKTGPIHTHNPDRKVEQLDDLPSPAFDLADFDEYERTGGGRKLAYATSIGCPYACNYCTDQVFYKRRFNALSAERVVGEMTSLVAKYKIDEVALLDSNFPVDLRRALEIARGIVDSGVKFKWTFQASTDFLSRMSDDDVRLLGEAGVSHMGFGTESTSEAVLKLMNKRHQRVNEMYTTARKAQIGGIKVTFNLILGYPGETEADRIVTFQTMSDIASKFNNVTFSPNIFTPYPGIPIWPQLRELGVYEPKTLKQWMTMPLGGSTLPWLQGEELRRLRCMLEYFLLNSQLHRASKQPSVARTLMRWVVRDSVRWRLRSSQYRFPWELRLARYVERVVARRSLVTGQELPVDAAGAC